MNRPSLQSTSSEDCAQREAEDQCDPPEQDRSEEARRWRDGATVEED